ncbi:Hypothetical protein UVM_LOCUS431 [uncultured virus]|nr:Hypothetical protein UVM_LOCUS431 [uncultured virus]
MEKTDNEDSPVIRLCYGGSVVPSTSDSPLSSLFDFRDGAAPSAISISFVPQELVDAVADIREEVCALGMAENLVSSFLGPFYDATAVSAWVTESAQRSIATLKRSFKVLERHRCAQLASAPAPDARKRTCFVRPPYLKPAVEGGDYRDVFVALQQASEKDQRELDTTNEEAACDEEVVRVILSEHAHRSPKMGV